MIIESGIDVIQVLCGSVSNDDPRGLWIIAMDENLRLLYIEPVVAEIVGGVEQHVDDIQLFLDGQNDVEYFALAWSTDAQHERESGWLRDLDARVRQQLAPSGRRLLGLVVFDPTTMFASVPSCEFSLEPDLADLPRAMAIAGPHGLDCRCPPCSADRREFEASYNYSDDEPWPASGSEQGYFEPPSRGKRSRVRASAWPEDGDPFVEPQYDPVSKRWYPDPERAYKRWTFDEEVSIARSHFAGLSCFDISLLVKRQPGAVASRLNTLGISSITVGREIPVGSALPVGSELQPPTGEPPPPGR